MQLGSKTHAKPVLEDMGWDEDSGATDVANAWGDGDLMDVNADEDDWGAFEAAAPEPAHAPPKPASITPSHPTPKTPKAAPPRASTLSPPKPKPRSSSPLASPGISTSDTWGTFEQDTPAATADASEGVKNLSLAGLSKEEKAAEMARRREERKQKIAQLKAQKQG
ncbi:hypothetical protein BDV93DRAFT_343881 [Ceratobasidium sp. AG-I]|nr:hypothetical protein BDV93DRAFT_343881 [Ceratobasidium sp. AG-I]